MSPKDLERDESAAAVPSPRIADADGEEHARRHGLAEDLHVLSVIIAAALTLPSGSDLGGV